MNRLDKNRQKLVENVPTYEKPKPSVFKILAITVAVICVLGAFAMISLVTSMDNVVLDAKKEFLENFEERKEQNAIYERGKMKAEVLSWEAEEILEKYGLNEYNHDTGYVSYDVSDYEKIDEINEDNLIGYYRAIKSGEDEFEKLIMAQGYKDWDDFLIKGGHVEDGKPEIYLWLYSEYMRLGSQD